MDMGHGKGHGHWRRAGSAFEIPRVKGNELHWMETVLNCTVVGMLVPKAN